MSPWLFNMYMAGVVREGMTRVMERETDRIMNGEDQEWEVNQILSADDTALVADSEEKLRSLVKEFGRGGRLKVNVGKVKDWNSA